MSGCTYQLYFLRQRIMICSYIENGVTSLFTDNVTNKQYLLYFWISSKLFFQGVGGGGLSLLLLGNIFASFVSTFFLFNFTFSFYLFLCQFRFCLFTINAFICISFLSLFFSRRIISFSTFLYRISTKEKEKEKEKEKIYIKLFKTAKM